MDKRGRWSLAPAFDVTYSYNPKGDWTVRHQMSLNGKLDHFEMSDFLACAKVASLKRGRGAAIVDEVRDAVSQWQEFADVAKISREWRARIKRDHRLTFTPK
jgi:serine/threonine-protein kinase HipA